MSWLRYLLAVAVLPAFAFGGCAIDDEICGGCTGDFGPPDPSLSCESSAAPQDGMDTLRIGQLVDGQFVELVGGETMTIQYGGQGGQHVFVALRLWSSAPIHYRYDLTFTGENAQTGSYVAQVDACDGQWTASDDVPVVLNSDLPGSGSLRIQATPDGGGTPFDVTLAVVLGEG